MSPRRATRTLALVTVAVAGLAAPAQATDGAVTFRYATYTPSLVRISPGGSVTFTPDPGVTFEDHPLMFVGDALPYASTGSSAPAKVFAAPGIYRFFCAIHGFARPDGTVGGMSGSVVVTANQPPVAAFTATPSTISAGQAVTLDAGASADDHAIAAYRWDFDDDGTIDESDPGTQPTATHVFTASSTVALTVVDDNADAVGPESGSATHLVTVTPVASAPAPPSGPPSTPPSRTPAGADHTAPHVSLVTRSLHLAELRGGRAKVTFTSTEAGSASATVKAGATKVATGSVRYTGAGRHSLTLKLTTAGRARLRHAKRAALRLSLIVGDAAGNRAPAKSLSLAHVT